MSALDGKALIEAWRALEDTAVAYQPQLRLSPVDLETRRTDVWEPVRFLGEPIRFVADRPLPSNCQHSIASALDDVTREVRTAAPNASGADTPAAHVSVPEGARCGVGGLGVLRGAR